MAKLELFKALPLYQDLVNCCTVAPLVTARLNGVTEKKDTLFP